RLLDLLPGLVNPDNEDKVFIVDELDRSLHPKLSYELIKLFLSNGVSESQLIATTHESHLLDQDLLRRDEIWFVEKDQNGASHVYSLEEYAPRYDKDIEKGYMMGRYGAIPVFGNMSFCEQEEG
ncbi:MAG: AAA family ATPase, partial [Chloroflexota bacterium]|nr:AAA family ATPase [Chloroflexota bacterium]